MDFYLICCLAAVLTFVFMVTAMPFFIRYLKNRNISQTASEYALEEFKNKDKTPIMGGLLFVIIPVIVFLIVNLKGIADRRFQFVLLSYVLYCSVGMIDDALIIASHKNDGLSPKTRLIMELVYSAGLFLLYKDILPMQVSVPFTSAVIHLKWYFYLPFMVLLYMAEANAVNFTDGMDGLCAGVSFIALVPFVILLYVQKNYHLTLFLICILAGLLGYLRFNFHPAKIFMGDSGSLALGALFASLGLMMDQTIALFVIGGVFVIEMFCVCLQQFMVRVFHRRVFSYTPIHYAFVIKGYKETRIVVMFYLLQLLLSVVGLYIGISLL